MRCLQTEEDAAEGSDWETASEEDMEVEGGLASTSGNEEAGEWDVRRSLFDNHVSSSLEANLEYMWKHFGFYLPDAEYILDPEALVQYLVCDSLNLMSLPCSALLWTVILFMMSIYEQPVSRCQQLNPIGCRYGR